MDPENEKYEKYEISKTNEISGTGENAETGAGTAGSGAPTPKKRRLPAIFNSIRAKYIVTFTLIMSLSYIIMAIVITSIVSQYTTSHRRDDLQRAADGVFEIIQNLSEEAGLTYYESLRTYDEQLTDIYEKLMGPEKNSVFFTDGSGSILLSTESARERLAVERLDAGTLNLIVTGQNHENFSDLFGILREKHLNICTPVYSDSGELVGLIVTSSPMEDINFFIAYVVKTVAVSFIWILLATVIVAIMISERITQPLKEMEKAAKSYSLGNFDVTVPETGIDSEVANLASAFNGMSKVIKENEMQRRSFLGSVSHDMRTPMTSIAGFVDGILDGTIPPEKQEHYLKIVSAETHRLSRLVNSMLDITRIQSGERKFNMASFDICELLRLVLISMEGQIDEKKLSVEFEPCDGKCFVKADSDGIHQVVYNLVHNAIKFTEEGGTLRLGVEKYEGKKYVITVYNTGKGIAKSELPYIFDRFYKADPSRGLDKSGAGLGLYIVKTIINSHGEKVWAESEEGKYCAFRFTLPYGSKHASDERKPAGK